MTNLELIKQHEIETRFCSFRNHMKECSKNYDLIISKGKDIVPDLLKHLKNKHTGMSVIMILEDILNQSPYTPEIKIPNILSYSVQECKNKWIEWGEKK